MFRRSSFKGILPIAAVCFLGAVLMYITKRSTEQTRGLIRFDPEAPFHLDFGRGSGLDGLETVAIEPGGRTRLCRRKRVGEWECTVIQLSRDQMKAVTDAIAHYQLVDLAKAYHRNVHDGTQWVLWIRQDGLQKVVYCNNRFPSYIRRFATEMDRILASSGIENVAWYPASPKTHDDELWNALR